MRTGYTLFELAAVLLLMTVATALLVPLTGSAVDRAAVRGAREAVTAVLAEARVRARILSGAQVELSGPPWVVSLTAGGVELRRVSLAREWGVVVDSVPPGETIRIRFDALGIGRVASRRIILRRNDAVARLVVSGFGRVRRE
ncbi:MAG: Tfp pilus assembly protein FimT/FimU [Gemmatimonadota bacterium]